MDEETRESARLEQSSLDDLQTRANQSKIKGWLIAGASVAALMGIAYWKVRGTDEEY